MSPHLYSITIITILLTTSVFPLESAIDKPFSNRIIFSQTPEIGEKWHGGIRMNDLLVWEGYWNCADLFTLDFFYAGIADFSFQGDNGDTITLSDHLTLFSLKSRPFQRAIWNHPYAAALGITLRSYTFDFQNQFGEGISSQPSSELEFFVTQGWFYKQHYFNLTLTASFMKKAPMEKAVTTLFIIPGYRLFIDKKKSWSFDVEHYFMNPVELPYKTLQYVFDDDNNEFYNPEQLFVSFTFIGFSYSGAHLRLQLHVGRHISFVGPMVPMAGIGWDF